MSPYFSNSFVDENFFDKTDPIEDKAEVVTQATVMLLKPYLDKVLTITAGNGKGSFINSLNQVLNTLL